ncbi:hypothetical protein CGC21_23525 [Leishmania donovani]|uniref:C3H1-type domain-containing protein n=1 Tax=Leishmania donovani TaxID=5661 RepID=A0A504XFZ5_LEIDO|nr:hypothetical protein CGC21_23525 [Leishmania donovani]
MSTTAYKEAVEAPATAARRRKAGRVNYLIENATPAMLCLVRAAEPKPYTALSPEALYEAVQPHDHTLRPSPFIAHQALMDFYKVCDGYYGVDREEVDKLNDYRIAQLRRNAQHVDNTVYHAHNSSNGSITSNVANAGISGVCHFYRTPEGCQRGAACPFTHLDKHGQPVNRVPKS